MKKGITAALLLLIAAACTKERTAPADGQYVGGTADFVLAVRLEAGRATSSDLFLRGELSGSWDRATTSGEYPDYVYGISDLTIRASFEDPQSFTGLLDGVLLDASGGPCRVTDEMPPLRFRLDNTQLDANGDGFLDAQ